MKIFNLVVACCLLVHTAQAQQTQKEAVAEVLLEWHKAASEADFNTYFDLMTSEGVFIGTDAMENWQNDAFKAFAKPYFDAGKAWSFTVVQQNIYMNDRQDMAWFDELLDTQMKICRGSGVVQKVDGKWKIAHYVLSIAVPNDDVSALVKLKADKDDALLKTLKQE